MVNLSEFSNKQWHNQQGNTKKDKRNDHADLIREYVRNNHYQKDDDICSDTIRSRTIFFSMIFSDMIEKSSFQEIDCDTKEDSHDKTWDI